MSHLCDGRRGQQDVSYTSVTHLNPQQFSSVLVLMLLLLYLRDLLVLMNPISAFSFSVAALAFTVSLKCRLVDDHWEITKLYFQSWFALDFIAFFPFQFVTGDTAVAKIGRVPRLFRCVWFDSLPVYSAQWLNIMLPLR